MTYKNIWAMYYLQESEIKLKEYGTLSTYLIENIEYV